MSVIILIVGAFLLNMGLSYVYKTYMIKRSHQEMLTVAEKFSENLSIVLDYSDMNTYIERNIKIEMQNLERYVDIFPIVLILNKAVITTGNNTLDNMYSLVYKELKKEEIENVLTTGKSIFRESHFKIGESDKHYTLIYPIRTLGNERIILLLNKSLPNINKTISEGTRYTILTIISVSIYAYVMIVLTTSRLTSEIQVLNTGVKDITKGNYNAKLKVDRSDEIGELSRNLMVMASSLKAVDSQRRKFISNISHDLRSPMTSIRGYINAIIDDVVPKEMHTKYLKKASEESDRMIKLINDILDLSKMQSVNFAINKSVVDIKTLLIDVVDSFEARLLEKEIDVAFNFDKEENVNCDKELIHRVVSNIIDNAVKFADVGGKLKISTKKKNKKLYVSIYNTGSSIDATDLPNIWKRFYKLDESRGRVKNSSGLGLSIVKEIIDMHKEDIEVRSKANYVEFEFTLSLAKTESLFQKHI